MKRFLYIMLAVIVVAVIANDALRYSQAQRRLADTTFDLARYGAEHLNEPRDKVASELVTMAGQNGVRVTMYGQGPNGIEIWTATNVEGTVFVGPVYNMVLGKKFADAISTPLVITTYRAAGPQ